MQKQRDIKFHKGQVLPLKQAFFFPITWLKNKIEKSKNKALWLKKFYKAGTN